MCGIVGIYNMNGAPTNLQVLQEMTDIQRHRGPDDQGMRLFSLKKRKAKSCGFQKDYWQNDEFEGGVGFNRLSILDLSENGHQPMCNENGSVFIVLNGEIYNAYQYRSELEAAGFRFRSTTDTEIVLYLYERYGFPAMLERLNGMFAICIVDLNTQELYLARDRMGIKPLYLYEYKGVFLFASEVKSFLRHPSWKPQLDVDRVDEYFAFRYCAGDGFLIKGVRQLEPGHWMRLHPNGWEQHKYWVIPDPQTNPHLSFDTALEMFEEHLHRSVRLRLLSDVKVGCQLSGGIDSSLVNISAALSSGTNMDAFSVVVDDPLLSEERWIDEAASVAKTASHKYLLDSKYFFDNLGRVAWHMDQPVNHPNSIGIFCVAESARPFVTVLLSGEGADELFGGYTRFYDALLRHKFYPWLPLISHLPYVKKRFAKQFANLQQTDPIGWFIASSSSQSADYLLNMRPESRLDKVLLARRAIFEEGRGDYLNNCLKYELRTYLVELLVRQDKMTMAHSMENRVPFLDHTLVSFVRNIPPQYLARVAPCLPSAFHQTRNRNTKILLKELALKHFDSDFVYRPKNGFGLPLKAFFTHPRCKPIMEDLLLPGMRNRGVIKANVIKGWWRNISKEGPEVSEALWTSVAFEMWAQQYLDGNLD